MTVYRTSYIVVLQIYYSGKEVLGVNYLTQKIESYGDLAYAV